MPFNMMIDDDDNHLYAIDHGMTWDGSNHHGPSKHLVAGSLDSKLEAELPEIQSRVNDLTSALDELIGRSETDMTRARLGQIMDLVRIHAPVAVTT